MTLVWEHAPCRENALIVLLALADWANDDGVSWPSMQRLADKTRIDRRSAQRIVRRLQDDGIITIDEGGGRAKQHHYQIETAALCRPLVSETAAESRPLDERNSDIANTKTAALETERATFPTQTATPVSPDPLEEPPEEPSREPSDPTPPFSSPEFAQALSDFFQNRKENKVKAYTPTGLRLLYRNLGEWGERDAIAALEDSVRGNWKGVFRPKVNASQNGNGQKLKGEYDPLTGELWVPKKFTWEDAARQCPNKNSDDIRLHFEGKLEWKDVRDAVTA